MTPLSRHRLDGTEPVPPDNGPRNRAHADRTRKHERTGSPPHPTTTPKLDEPVTHR
jgi:hypothetical protein